jgi:hypothetical protein
MLTELAVYACIRLWVAVHELFVVWRSKHRGLKDQMREATRYADWRVSAQALDASMNKDAWKQQDESPFYDYRLIRRVTRMLCNYRTVIGQLILFVISYYRWLKATIRLRIV